MFTFIIYINKVFTLEWKKDTFLSVMYSLMWCLIADIQYIEDDDAYDIND